MLDAELLAERSAKITLWDMELDLMLSSKATKAIAERYGSMEELAEKLMQSDKMAIDEVIWLLTLLANQTIMIHNLRNRDEPPHELLIEDDVELLTTPFDLASYREALAECVMKGTARHIVSGEDDGPNPPSA